MSVDDLPEDWAQLHWHRCPGPARYRSRETATRACRWLNSHDGEHARWLFRPGGRDGDRWWLDRRWIGHAVGLLDLEAGLSNPPSADGGAEGS